MKKKFLHSLTLFLLVLLPGLLKAQVFLDENFDSYSDGEDIVVTSENWFPVFSEFFMEGPTISSAQFSSPSNSLRFANDLFGRYFHPTATDGVMTYTMDLLIPSEKNFIFSVGDTTSPMPIGAIFRFDSDGNIEMENPITHETIFSATYDQDEWFEFKVRVDLEISLWKCFINGTQIGSSFTYPELMKLLMWDYQGIFVSDGDIDPTSPIEAFIDNMRIEKTESEYFGLDIGISDIAADFGLTGQTREVRARVFNYGATTINSFDITMNYNDGEVISTKEYTDLNLITAENIVVSFDDMIVLENGKSFTCTVSNINGAETDDEIENNALTEALPFLYTPAEHKVVYAEEATGSWCGFCPVARVQLEWLETYFGDYIEAVAVHNGDPMTTVEYSASAMGVSGYPTTFFDRVEATPMYKLLFMNSGFYDDDLFLFPIDPTPFMERLTTPPAAVINPEFTYNESTGIVEVTANFEFLTGGENYKVACSVIENGISGSESSYDQSNYPSETDQVVAPDGTNYFDLPHPIPASEMVYNHVGRLITPDENGGDVIESAAAGEVVTRNFTLTIEEGWDPEKIKIIVILFDPDGGLEINNVKAVPLVEEVDVSAINEESSTSKALVYAYPNPTEGNTNLVVSLSPQVETTITVTSIDGKFIQNFKLPKGKNNSTRTLELNMHSHGIYFASVIQGETSETIKIIKN